MTIKRPEEEGVVLRNINEVARVAEEKLGEWPPLEEPTFDGAPQPPTFAEWVSVLTMAFLLVAVTIYAITTADREVIKAILTIAAGSLIALTRFRRKSAAGEKEKDDSRDPKGPTKGNKSRHSRQGSDDS